MSNLATELSSVLAEFSSGQTLLADDISKSKQTINGLCKGRIKISSKLLKEILNWHRFNKEQRLRIVIAYLKDQAIACSTDSDELIISARLDENDTLLSIFTDITIPRDLRRRIALLLMESSNSEIARNFVMSYTDFLEARYDSELKAVAEEPEEYDKS